MNEEIITEDTCKVYQDNNKKCDKQERENQEKIAELMKKNKQLESQIFQTQVNSTISELYNISKQQEQQEKIDYLTEINKINSKVMMYQQNINNYMLMKNYHNTISTAIEFNDYISSIGYKYLNKQYKDMVHLVDYSSQQTMMKSNYKTIGDCYYELNNLVSAYEYYKKSADTHSMNKCQNKINENIDSLISKINVLFNSIDPYVNYDLSDINKYINEINNYKDKANIHRNINDITMKYEYYKNLKNVENLVKSNSVINFNENNNYHVIKNNYDKIMDFYNKYFHKDYFIDIGYKVIKDQYDIVIEKEYEQTLREEREKLRQTNIRIQNEILQLINDYNIKLKECNISEAINIFNNIIKKACLISNDTSRSDIMNNNMKYTPLVYFNEIEKKINDEKVKYFNNQHIFLSQLKSSLSNFKDIYNCEELERHVVNICKSEYYKFIGLPNETVIDKINSIINSIKVELSTCEKWYFWTSCTYQIDLYLFESKLKDLIEHYSLINNNVNRYSNLLIMNEQVVEAISINETSIPTAIPVMLD